MAGQGAIIGIDATAALTQGGGIGRYTRELIRALVAEAPHNHYTLFSARPPAVLPVADSLPVAPNVAHRPAPVDERWLYRLWSVSYTHLPRGPHRPRPPAPPTRRPGPPVRPSCR